MAQFFAVFLNVLTPVFSLVVLGYVAGKRLGLDARTLSRLAYFILTPAFVFGYMSNAHIDGALAARMIAFISAVYAGSTVIAFVVARLMRRDRATTAAFVMMAAFGNVGNYGLPISKFSQGDAAIVPSAIYFLANLVLAFVICVWAANSAGDSRVMARWRAVLNVLKTPALLALVPAMVFNALDVRWPLFVTRPLDLLGNALIAIMLLTLGAQLAVAGIPRPSRDMLAAISVRLLSGPLLAFALAGLFGLTGIERNTGIILASMPSAVLVSIIALEYRVRPEFVTASVLLSNVLSIVTLTVVLSLL
jgi:malate permease and related proteins